MAKSNEKIKTTEDIMFELAKPFSKQEIQWRVQRLKRDGTSGMA